MGQLSTLILQKYQNLKFYNHKVIMNTIRILIVEDEQLVADDLRETLENMGYCVPDLVTSGEDAIFKAQSLQPDLVLMDIRLEGEIDGVEASQKIQSSFNIPVVYLTANADRATLERVKASHPFGYILKPFDEKTLSTTIEIALSRHQAEVEMQKAMIIAQVGKQDAVSQSQIKSQYLYMAAHEFRNPLAAIKLGTEMLKYYGSQMPDDKKQNHLKRIELATDNLTDLLEDVLTLGRTESGKLIYEPTQIDVVNFCKDMIESLQMTRGEGYIFNLFTIGDKQPVFLDEKLLWHLLDNLLSNAIKYSSLGSNIALTISWEQDIICFKIKDEGIGIPKEAITNLFEPFQRASNVGNISGTGLGLAIVKQCVDLHGGTIDIESIVNEGTTFTVRLPLKQ